MKNLESISTKASEESPMTCTSKSQAIFEEDADSIVISDVDEV